MCGVSWCGFRNLATEASDVCATRNVLPFCLPLASGRVSSASQPACYLPEQSRRVLCPCRAALMQPVAVHCSAVCITSAAAGVGCARDAFLSLVTKQANAARCNSRLTQLSKQASERELPHTALSFQNASVEENMIFFLYIDG